MRVIFIGDIHAFAPSLAWHYWLSKCALGWLNMKLNPNRKFNFDLWPGTLQRMRELNPDWVLCSGDLTQLAMEEEFAMVIKPWRLTLGHCRTVVVPGNHDRYTHRSVREKTFEKCLGDLASSTYPYWQRLTDHWHLLALDSTCTHLLDATGSIGDAQLQAVAERITTLTPDDGLLLLTHYPVLLPPGRRDTPGHKLRDSMELRKILSQCRARIIYLHGHVHEPWSFRVKEPTLAHLHMLNAGCPMRCSTEYPQGQGFWELHLPDLGKQPVHLTRHRLVCDQWQTIEESI